MNRLNKPSRVRPGRTTLGLVTAVFALLMLPATVWAQAPDLTVGADRFPGADGIILRWEQSWTLDKDGTVHRRDHQWFKYLSSRPIRSTADPRLDFHATQDELKIHTARTHLSDGRILPVPDYSFNLAGPSDVAGWPAYADWRQMVVSFSGIEDGAVIELDYEVITQPRVMPWIDADLRLQQTYPTLERVVTVMVPAGVPLHYRVDGVEGDHLTRTEGTESTTYHWVFKDLPGAPGEPQALPWQQRCGRLRFTTAKDGAFWAKAFVWGAEMAALPDAQLKQFAESAVKDEVDPTERVRLVARKLHDSFNFITSWKARRPLSCRAAGEVLRSNYGNDVEAASLLAAALRALGMQATPAVAVDATIWDPQVPTDSCLAGLAVAVQLPDETIYVHPRHGLLHNPGDFGRHLLISAAEDGGITETYIRARGEDQGSNLEITGKLTLKPDGKAAGELRVRLTGAFYDPADLTSGDAQKSLLRGLLGRVLTGFKVGDWAVTQLSDEVLQATVQVSTDKDLPELAGRRVLQFGSGPAFLGSFPLPLDRSYRTSDVDTGGPFGEVLDLTVELPDGYHATLVPAALATEIEPWGSVRQTVEARDGSLRLRRVIAVTQEHLSSGAFAQLRQTLNRLRATESLLLTYEKK